MRGRDGWEIKIKRLEEIHDDKNTKKKQKNTEIENYKEPRRKKNSIDKKYRTDPTLERQKKKYICTG